MTLLPIKSTRNMFPGIIVQGSATISQDVFISGSLNANIVGKFPIGDGLDLQHGTLSSTVTGGGGTTTILSGTNIQVGGGTVSVVDSPNFSGTVVSNGIIVLATVTGSSPPAVTFSSPTVGPTIALGITPVGTTQTGATIVYGAFDRYTVASGVSTLLSLSDLFILGNNTASTIRSYNSYEYHITVPLTVDQVKSMPLGSGLASANGTIYATGGASSASITPNYIVAQSGTLFIGAFTGQTTSTQVTNSPIISIVNAQASSSPPNFQQYVSLNLSGFGTQINSDFSNVQFTDTTGSTVIPSWQESGTLNTGTATFWLLLEQGIPATSTIQILMTIGPSNANYFSSSVTGLSPVVATLLGKTYGFADTGSIVFGSISSGFYENFAGTVLSPIWTSTGLNITVNNGIVTKATGTGFSPLLAYHSSIVPQTVLDFHSILDNAGGYSGIGGLATQTVNQNAAEIIAHSGSVYTQQVGSAGSPVGPTFPTSATQYHVWSIYFISTLSTGYQQDYGLIGTIAGVGTTSPSYPINVLAAYSQSAANTITSNWVRERAYPPNGVMPIVSVSGTVTGTVVATITISPTIEFESGISFINPPTASSTVIWHSIFGKPFVTLSAYGTINASSSIINNGADYGPDTPNTTTWGVQEAINALPQSTNNLQSSGGGKLFFTAGTYAISSQINIPNSFAYDLVMDGAGQMTTLLWWHGPSTIPMIYSGTQFRPDTLNLVMRDLSFVAPSGNLMPMLRLNGTNSIEADDCGFFSSQYLTSSNGNPGRGFANDPGTPTSSSPQGLIGIDLPSVGNDTYLFKFCNFGDLAFGAWVTSDHVMFDTCNFFFISAYTTTNSSPYTYTNGWTTPLNIAGAAIRYYVSQERANVTGSTINGSENEQMFNCHTYGSNAVAWFDSFSGSVTGILTPLITNGNHEYLNHDFLTSYNGVVLVENEIMAGTIPLGFVYPTGSIISSATLYSNINIRNGRLVFNYAQQDTAIPQLTTPTSGNTYQNTTTFDAKVYSQIAFYPTSSAAATLTVLVDTQNPPRGIQVQTIRPASSVSGEVQTYLVTIPQGWYYQYNVVNATIVSINPMHN